MFLCYDYTRGFPVCQPPNAKKKTIAKPQLPSFLLLHAVEFVLYGLLFFFERCAFLLLAGETLAAGKCGKQDGFTRIYWQGIREEAQENRKQEYRARGTGGGSNGHGGDRPRSRNRGGQKPRGTRPLGGSLLPTGRHAQHHRRAKRDTGDREMTALSVFFDKNTTGDPVVFLSLNVLYDLFGVTRDCKPVPRRRSRGRTWSRSRSVRYSPLLRVRYATRGPAY